MTGAPEPAGLDWLLEDLAARAGQVRQTVIEMDSALLAEPRPPGQTTSAS